MVLIEEGTTEYEFARESYSRYHAVAGGTVKRAHPSGKETQRHMASEWVSILCRGTGFMPSPSRKSYPAFLIVNRKLFDVELGEWLAVQPRKVR